MLSSFDLGMLGPEDGFDLSSLSDQQMAGMSGHSGHGYAQQSQHYHHAASTHSGGYGAWQGYPASTTTMTGGYGSTAGQEYHDDGYTDYQMQYGSDPRYWPQGR
jgi:hypothetical protein